MRRYREQQPLQPQISQMTQIPWFDGQPELTWRLDPATRERKPAPRAACSNLPQGASARLAVRCDKSQGLYKARQAS